MDIFIEKIVARKRTSIDLLINVGLVIVAIVVMFFVPTIPAISSYGIFIAAGLFYGVYYLSSSKNVEYEYAITNGDLDIDTIIARRKRKRIFSGNGKEFEILAKKNSSYFTPQIANITNKVIAVSSLDSPNVYFIVANYKGARTLVFFEPDQRMLTAFKTYNPRKVFE